jgi:hypothetical protein
VDKRLFAGASVVALILTLSKQGSVPGTNLPEQAVSSAAPPLEGSSPSAASYCNLPLDEGPWKTAAKVFASSSSPNTSCAAAEHGPSWSCVREPDKIQFLIAAVANPHRTHLALYTDRALESIMWAIGDAGYTLQEQWLPWSDPSLSTPLTILEQQCRTRVRDAREAEPGLMIFRHVGGGATASSYLFLFVVGETPTSGIDSVPLKKAVDYIRQIGPQTTNIRLLGPTFSGSFGPLSIALGATPHQLTFHIVTGTASSAPAIATFKQDLPATWRFESTVENDFHVADLLFRYANAEWHPWFGSPGEIAVLSEDETVFGHLEWPNRPIPESALNHKLLLIRYPREIARLRNAIPENPVADSKQTASNGSPLSVLLSLKDTRPIDTRQEAVDTFSAQQSPASQQASLVAISSQLRRERASFTGIIATDVLDSLFLTEFVRRSTPDIRVFLLDSDLLFLRESQTAPLFGTLCVTNYPLVSRNQHWTEKQVKGQMPRRIQFNSRFAEGLYNACRRLVPNAEASDAEQFLEYRRPFPSPGGRPSSCRPALWLTALGHDGYWPIALLDEDDQKLDGSTLSSFCTGKDIDLTPAEAFHPEPPSNVWGLLFWFAGSFCFLHAIYVYWLLSRDEGRLADPPGLFCSSLAKLFRAYPSGRPTGPERTFLLAATVSLLSTWLIFSLPLARFLSFGWAQWRFSIAIVVLASLLVSAVRLSIGPVTLPRAFALSCLLGISFLTVWTYLILRSDHHGGILLAYRALYLGNGVSPGLPILVLAAVFYSWAWMHLKREGASANRAEVTRDLRPSYLNEWHDAIYKVDEAIADTSSLSISFPALLFVAVWFVIVSPLATLRTFENIWYDGLYIFSLAVLYWCIALVWVQFLRCWLHFRDFLRALERHQIRNAFSRLPKQISWIPLATGPGRNLFLSSRTVSSLEALIATAAGEPVRRAWDWTVFNGPAKSARSLLRLLEVDLAVKNDVDVSLYAYLQECLDWVASLIMTYLRAEQWKRGESDSLSGDAPGKLVVLGEELIALRLLVFVRYVIRQLRNFVGFIIAGFIVSILSLHAYPFQATRWIGITTVIVFVIIGAGIVFVFAEMDKDAILSRITDTQANHVGKTFFVRLATFGALPLLTVLASQFPSIGQMISTWLQPAIDAVK